MALCLAGGGATVRLALAAFSLIWTHTVEKIPWREDWRVEGDRLVIERVMIKGSGAGMEPDPSARLLDGWYVWRPDNGVRAKVVLRRAAAPGVGDWTLCTPAGACRPLAEILPADADPVTLAACADAAPLPDSGRLR